jgi:hypothetical protein
MQIATENVYNKRQQKSFNRMFLSLSLSLSLSISLSRNSSCLRFKVLSGLPDCPGKTCVGFPSRTSGILRYRLLSLTPCPGGLYSSLCSHSHPQGVTQDETHVRLRLSQHHLVSYLACGFKVLTGPNVTCHWKSNENRVFTKLASFGPFKVAQRLQVFVLLKLHTFFI